MNNSLEFEILIFSKNTFKKYLHTTHNKNINNMVLNKTSHNNTQTDVQLSHKTHIKSSIGIMAKS
jgi:hypothetical protein